MFKKLALTTATLVSVFGASLALSGAAHADDPWDWKHRHHHFPGNMGGPNMPHPGVHHWHHPGGGNWGGGPFFWGGPGFFFGGPLFDDGYYYDEPVYWPHRHCKVHKVKKHHHWVWRKVCYSY